MLYGGVGRCVTWVYQIKNSFFFSLNKGFISDGPLSVKMGTADLCTLPSICFAEQGLQAISWSLGALSLPIRPSPGV